MRAGSAASIAVEGNGELDPGVSGIVIDDVELPLGSSIRKAPLQCVKQVLVKELKLNRDRYSFAHNITVLKAGVRMLVMNIYRYTLSPTVSPIKRILRRPPAICSTP